MYQQIYICACFCSKVCVSWRIYVYICWRGVLIREQKFTQIDASTTQPTQSGPESGGMGIPGARDTLIGHNGNAGCKFFNLITHIRRRWWCWFRFWWWEW